LASSGSIELLGYPKGVLLAPDGSHAIRAAINEALEARAEGRPRTILFCLSGHGHFDLSAYDAHLSGKLEDYEYPTEEVRRSIEPLPVTL
jgi:predicted alternative tryptophan synthase beta-subunit